MIRRLFPIAALVAVVFAGCGGGTASPSPSPTPDLAAMRAAIAADFPRLDGSTSDFPLLRLMACDLYGVQCAWSAKATDNVERTFIPDPAANVPEAAAKKILDVKVTTTSPSIMNLIEGKTDLIIVARKLSADEQAAADKKGVKLDIRPVALDAFVFLVNVENQADSLPLATLRDIYAGRIKTWKDAGVGTDPSAPINAYQRERNSGSQELLQSLVMKGQPVIDAPDMIVLTMLGPFNKLGGNPKTGSAGDKLGLGYSVYYYAAVMFSNDGVKLIGVDGVKPTSDTIASRQYPLTAEVYVVTRTDANAATARLRDWMLSPDGQRVVEKSGYVPISTPAK